MNDMVFENGLFGTRTIIKGVWQDIYLKFFLEKDVQKLELNDDRRFRIY